MPKIIRIQGEAEKAKGIHYEVDAEIEPIGAGGMGNVMRGVMVNEHTKTKRDVAIKFVYDDLPQSTIERAKREGSVCLKNDNLIEMLGFIETCTYDREGNAVPHYHVVSELLHGVSLKELIAGKTISNDGMQIEYAAELAKLKDSDPELFAKTVCEAVLKGLMALHDAGYIHRDIDPSNIMVTHDRKIKLIDFGISRKINEEREGLTIAGKFMGKAEYASPELALGDLNYQNQTTDLYAMGIMLYELILGTRPFEGPLNEVLQHQINDPVPVRDFANRNIRKIIAKACAKDQLERYQSAIEFLYALDQYDVEQPLTWQEKWEDFKESVGMSTIIAVACVVLLAGAGAGAYFFFKKDSSSTSITAGKSDDELLSQAKELLSKAEHYKEQGDKAADDDYDNIYVPYCEAMKYYIKADETCRVIKDQDLLGDLKGFAADQKKVAKALAAAYTSYYDKYRKFKALDDKEAMDEFSNKMKMIEEVIKINKPANISDDDSSAPEEEQKSSSKKSKKRRH